MSLFETLPRKDMQIPTVVVGNVKTRTRISHNLTRFLRRTRKGGRVFEERHCIVQVHKFQESSTKQSLVGQFVYFLIDGTLALTAASVCLTRTKNDDETAGWTFA